MAGSARDRVFSRLADVGLGRPGLVLAIAGVLVLIAAVLVPGLRVSTSRTGLVSVEDPGQERLEAFFERFGRPDAPVFLVSGGTVDERREVVDRLQRALQAQEDLAGRVMGRIEPADVADILLLQQPDALSQMRARLPPEVGPLPELLEGGVVAWLGALEQQILGALDAGDEAADAVDEAEPPPEAGGPSLAEATAGLEQLATMAAVLEDYATGRDPLARMTGEGLEERVGMDERGYLTSASGEHHLVAVYPDLQSDEGRDLEPFVERLRSIRDDVMKDAPSGVRADLTGLPGIIVDELEIIREGLIVSSIATTLGIFLLCLILFRSLRQTIVALIILLPGVVLTLAAVRLLYDDLNLITSSFVAVLLGLGIDFAVHMVARRNEEVRRGLADADAVRTALVHTGPGIMTGAVITAAAFLTTATTDFTAYGELGVVTAIGLMVIMVATFTVLPALLVTRGKREPRVAPEPPGLARLPDIIRRLRWPLAVLGIAAGIGSAAALSSVEFNPRYFDFLPTNTESARGLTELEYDAVASPVFANLSADSISEAREMTERLRSFSSVAGVQTPTDLLPPLSEADLAALREGFAGLQRDPDFDALAHKEVASDELRRAVRGVTDALDEARFAMQGAGMPTESAERAKDAFASLGDALEGLDPAGRERVAGMHRRLAALLAPAWETARAVAKRGHYIPADLPELFKHRFVSTDGKSVALFVVPAGDFWEQDVAQRFAADVRSVDPEASGLALDHVRHGNMVMQGFQRAAAYAAGLVLVMLWLDFRSIRDSLLALIPTALGWLWMIGIMAVVGLTFDVANVVSLPLVIGIGIAFGVHMMHRATEAPRTGKGDKASVDEVVRGTGGAIGVAALTTMVGFGGLMTSAYGGMQSFGLVMVIGIGACLIATLLVLPAVLLILRRTQ